jgi:hypothetical protein
MLSLSHPDVTLPLLVKKNDTSGGPPAQARGNELFNPISTPAGKTGESTTFINQIPAILR